MLRDCIISFGNNWEKSLPFAKFSYNNSFQSSLNIAPFELLYGRRCRTPLNCSETGERQFFGPNMIKEAEDQVCIFRDQLKAAQSRQKSYYDRHHRQESYNVDEKAYLRVTTLKGTQRFGIKGKLAPRYIGPFRILAKRCQVAYQLELPPHLSRVHDVFHVSQLRRCFKDPIREADHETLDLQDDLSYREYPIRILDSASVSLADKRLSFSKFNGHTTLRKKPRGKEKTVSVLSTPHSSRRLLNLGTRFF